MVCCCRLLDAMDKGYRAWKRHHISKMCMGRTTFGELMGQVLGQVVPESKIRIGCGGQ